MRKLAQGGAFFGEHYAPPTARQHALVVLISLIGVGSCLTLMLAAGPKW